jgi:UDPglucose--hexose-1-phosphate uridylyltransferase
VVIAPTRARRPGAEGERIPDATDEELASCPFCAGREDQTPPETLRIGDPWRVRVFPNLFPAFERQEVVVHSPEHVRSFADLDAEQLAAVAEAWHERHESSWAEGGFAYLHVFVNEGRAAGASLPHSHSQLVSLASPPPEVAAEAARLREGDCELCRLVRRERGDGRRLVASRHGVVLLAAYAGRVPYELLIAPEDHHGGQDGTDGGDFLVAALELLADGIRRLRALEGAVPWNAWLHNSGHWHVEVVPRLTVFAGIELGAGVYVNSLPPEDAAAALRGV